MELWLFDNSTSVRKTIHVEVEPITIGRDDDCQIVLKSPFVARKHARIVRKGNQFFLENLGRSSTRVANREVTWEHPTRIDFGDEIQVAQYSLVIVRPGRKSGGRDNRHEMQRRLIAFEQASHAELLEKLNLRVTGAINKGDATFVEQIIHRMEEVLDQRVPQMDEALIVHAVNVHLHRLVVAEVARQCQGRVQTDYHAADERTLDAAREKAIVELVASIVDMMPLLFDPTSVNEDLTLADESFEDLFTQVLPSISTGLRQYVVRRTVSKDIQDVMFGLGPLQDLLEMANVTEIMVVGKDRIYVEKNGVIQTTTRSFFTDEILMSVIERILAPIGRRVDQSSPMVDARLPDGSRVNVIIPPLSLCGPTLTIRKFSWIPFTIDDLIDRGSLSARAAEFLQGCILGRKNIMISGGTGSGKTTLLNVISAYARPSERIITIEESAELRLPQPHVVSLEGRPANIEGKGAYTIRELVKNALRMRPDRIIVGEVRGPEAMDMLQAMNTGHDGSLSTIHANAPPETCQRLETLVMMGVDMPVRAIREQIVSAVDLVVQIARFADGRRRVTHITELHSLDRDTGEIVLGDIFLLRDQDQSALRHTGYIPTFAPELIAKGLLSVNVFL